MCFCYHFSVQLFENYKHKAPMTLKCSPIILLQNEIDEVAFSLTKNNYNMN